MTRSMTLALIKARLFLEDARGDILESRGMLLVFVLLVALVGLKVLGNNLNSFFNNLAQNFK